MRWISRPRLDYLRVDPARKAKNALKVLIVFKLLDVRAMTFAELIDMTHTCPRHARRCQHARSAYA